MGKLRERRKAAALASPVEKEIARESAFVERAENPLKQHEINSKAFNLVWLDFFKMFSLCICAASLWTIYQSSLNGNQEQLIFAVLTLNCFVQARNWLSQVNVAMQVSKESPGAMLSRSLFLFLAAVFMQSLMPLVMFWVYRYPLSKCREFFPTGLIFLFVSSSAVAYMRWSAYRTEVLREDLTKKLLSAH